MSALEREIIEKFHQLQPAEKQRVRLIIDQATDAEAKQTDAATFDYADWASNVSRLRLQMQGHEDLSVVEMLRNLRAGEDE
jgi:hypothetical protein